MHGKCGPPTARGLNFYYGEHHALKNINITLGTNRVTAFIGPSGCGKTTVLRTLNRMNDLIVGARVEGDIHYRGASLYERSVSPTAVRRRIGMVFQKPNPFPAMSIADGNFDPVIAARAKLQISRSGRHISQEAIQLHGGIGVTAEYPVGHYAARLTAINQTLGSADDQLHTLIGAPPRSRPRAPKLFTVYCVFQ